MNDFGAHPVVLQRYTHLSPADGMCLMEYVSLLAGTGFTDRPACTDALLAALARMVNDTVSDAGRSRLIHLAPLLVRGAPDAGVRDRVVFHCWDAVGAAAAPGSRAERHARRRRDTARARLKACRREGRVPAWLRLHGPARRAAETAVRVLSALPPAEADRALLRLLTLCTTQTAPDDRQVPERRPAGRSGACRKPERSRTDAPGAARVTDASSAAVRSGTTCPAHPPTPAPAAVLGPRT
ncbi:hypothetical protein [Streptomyces kebangsaanensis]|uniref:hypothetical protein n=1 Tax=Streptomyces kebangsaanensis TaxID=864058 RepID=UPI00093E036E|nr:hypothetical protein [Streptomyces kebangsaanensis]